jgi:acyl-CoA reductase-like NAD-dependent aldehyde dehydrogenase
MGDADIDRAARLAAQGATRNSGQQRPLVLSCRSLTPFDGIKDSGLGYKEGVLEAMKSFTNVKTYSLPW